MNVEAVSVEDAPEKTCHYIYSFADNGWADHTCDKCGFTVNLDVHCPTGYNYCPGCGRKVVSDPTLYFDGDAGKMYIKDMK